MNDLPKTDNILLSINEASRELGVSNKTLRRWEDKMLLVPMRTLGGHRRYSKAQVEAFKKQRKQKSNLITHSPASPKITNKKTLSRFKTKVGLTMVLTGLALFFVLTGKYAVNKFDLGKIKNSVNTKFSNIAENISKSGDAVELNSFGKSENKNVLAELTAAEDVEFNINVEANFEELIRANGDISTDQDIFNLINENATTLNIGGAATALSVGADTGETTINNTLNANNGFQLGGTSVTSTAVELNYLDGATVTAGGIIYGDGTTFNNTGAGTTNQVLTSNGSAAPTWTSLTSITSGFLRSDTSDSYTSGTLDFSDGTFLDLSAIKHDDSGLQGIRLPQNTSFSNPSSGEGFLAWNSSTNILQVYDGTAWTGVTTTGTNQWTGASGVIYAQTLTNNLTLGSSSNLAKLGIDGDTDEVQLLVQANSTQTSDVFVLEKSDGTNILSVANDGSGTLTHSSSSNFAINLTGTGDFVIQDGGTAFATFSDNGLFTVNSVTLDAGTISSTGDVTIDPTSNLVLADLDCSGNANGGALTVDASGIVSCSDDDGGGAGALAWSTTGGKIYPTTISDELGIGTSTTSEIISKLYVTSESSLTGKAVAIFNQGESEDIISASASGYTKFFIDNNGRMAVGYNNNTGGTALTNPFEVYNEGTTQVASITTAGNLQIDGDATISGGDIDVSGEAANIAIIDGTSGALTISQGANEYLNITTSDNVESFTLNLPTGGGTSQTANLFNSNIAKTINLGVGTAADTINIGTGGTTADDINIGGLATSTIDVLGVSTFGDGGSTNYASFNATGDLTFYGSGDTITGPGASGLTITNTSGNISFVTATAGDVTIGPPTSLGADDDLIFQDGTLSSAIPLTSAASSLNTPTSAIIDAINEAYAAATGGTGGAWTLASNVIYPSVLGDRVGIGTTTVGDVASKLYISSEATHLTGKALAILNQTESEDVFTASASGDSLFSIAASSEDSGEIRLFEEASNGKQYTGFKAPASLAGNVVYTLPTASAASGDYVLTWQSGDTLQWKEVTGVGGAGDITAVGSIGSGIAFASSATADDQWLGIGATDGRIEFDDQAIDEVNIQAAKLGLGTSTPLSLFHAETNTTSLTGKAVAVINQLESEDIFTASASNSTKFFIDNNGRVAIGYSNATGGTALTYPFEVYNEGTTQVASITTAGNLQIDGDATISGGDIDVSGEAADLSIIDASGTAFRIVQGSDVYFGIDTTDNQEAFTINLPAGGVTSQTANLFNSNIAKTINLGTGTAIDTINIGTGGTGADVINIGSANAGNVTIRSNAVLNLTGSTNSLIDFPNFDVSTAGAITAASDLDINGTSNDIAGALNLSGNSLTASGDLVIDPAGDDITFDGDVLINDTFTLQVGGKTATAYNTFADAADTSISGQLDSDDDLFVGGSVELLGSLCFGSDCASDWASGGGSPWTYSTPYLYPDNTTDRIGIGTTTTADMISRLYVTNTSTLTGKAVAIFNQSESEDIFTASASNSTKFFIDNNGRVAIGYSNATGGTALTYPFEVYNEGTTQVASITTAGNLQIDGDATISGGDISGPSGENIDLGEIEANSIIFQINTASELGLSATALYPSSVEGLALGAATNEFEALYLGDDNGAFFGLDQDWSLGYDEATDNRLELVTSGTSGMLLSSATVTGTGLLATFDSMTTGTGIDLSVDAITQGKGLNISNTANTLTTGTLLNVDSTSTAVTGSSTGLLGYFNWNPGSATTATGDLFRINIGSSGNVGNVFNVTDNGSTLFSVGETGITSAVPHEFTAAGDVSIAYDIQFTNQTASYVKSYAPLYIQAGEPQESNNLTLQTFNSGDIVFENGDSGVIANFGGDGTTTITNTTAVLSGKSALIVDQKETEHIFTASASAATKFVIASDGKVYIGDNTTLATSTALCWASTTINGATVYQVGDCTGTPADLAEWYPASSTDLPQPGDIVTIGDSLGTYTTNDGVVHNTFSVKKASSPYDPKMIGIISTKSFQTMGEDVLDWADSAVQVGLVGRVPIKIASTSDAIEPGDFLTSSEEPGRAKKADSDGGYTIAKALEKWTPGSGADTILVYINASVKLPEVAANDPLFNDNTNVLTGFNATTSATLAELNVTDLTVFGDTILADTTITGGLNIGMLQFNGFDNSVDAVGTLKLQPLALGDIEIMNGLVTIDTNGNIVAQEITAKKYSVAGASAGTATISSGNSSVFVSTGLVTNDSLIFVTPKKSLSYPLAVTSKNDGNGFTVTIPSDAGSNIDFDWFIVDKK